MSVQRSCTPQSKALMMNRRLYVSSLLVLSFFSAACQTATPVAEAPIVAPLPPPAPIVIAPPPPPDPHVVARRHAALSNELERLWTRDAAPLVDVCANAAATTNDSPPLTFLLAIAHAETNGRILDVSEAGAVGLAQATPVAFLMEHFQGKLFVTEDYIEGEKAYLLKKPLHDADVIASLVLEDGETALPRARELLAAAVELRSEGVDELNVLAPFAGPKFFSGIDEATEKNAAMLAECAELLEKGNRPALTKFRDRVRGEYRAMRQLQMAKWVLYQRDLIAARDRMLREHFGAEPVIVRRDFAYAAGEFLARELDDRFSPNSMACFLSSHLRTKTEEALRLGTDSDHLEQLTSALYNGGSHNVKRMRAGLITSLPETENYMHKVPLTKHRLDAVIDALDQHSDIASNHSAQSSGGSHSRASN